MSDNKNEIDDAAITSLAGNVLNKMEQIASIKAAKDTVSMYRDINLDENFRYGKILDESSFNTMKNVLGKKEDEISDEDYLSFSNANDRLSNLQQTAQEKIASMTADRQKLAEKESESMQRSSYRNIIGANIPVPSSINDYEVLSDNYPAHNAELQSVSNQGIRGFEHKNWMTACLNKDSATSNSHSAYQTWNEDRQKLSQDLDPRNASNYLYKPQVLSQSAHREYHSQLPSVEKNLHVNTPQSLSATNTAMDEIRGKIEDVMQYESSELISCY